MIFKKLLILLSFFLFPFFINANITINNGLTHTYKVKEGTIQKGLISIQNNSNKVQTVKLYQQDYSYNSKGESFYSDFGKNNRSNLKWINLSNNLININPNSKADISYEIIIPDKIPNGSTWSIIMVEPVEEIDQKNENNGIQIKSIIRYSIQIITTNDNSIESLLNFESVKLNKDTSTLEISLSNQGNLFENVELNIELFDQKDGTRIGTFKSNKMGILPNNSKLFTIDLSNVPKNIYTSSLLANSSEGNTFGINIDLNLMYE